MKEIKEIKFIILSCDKYIDSRVKSIKETFLSNEDNLFLVDSFTEIENLTGYNTPKDYDGIQDKYKMFFINNDFSTHKYFFFIDDDTFVNLQNLKKLELPNYDTDFCIYRKCYLGVGGFDLFGQQTGYPMHKIKGINTELPLLHPSGGSGFILSQSSCYKIQKFLKSISYDQIPISGHSDVTIGFWMRSNNINLIENQNLWYKKPEDLYLESTVKFSKELESDALTFHYVSPEQMYEYHEKYNNGI